MHDFRVSDLNAGMYYARMPEGDKLQTTVTHLRLDLSTLRELNNAVERLGLPRLQIMRLAIEAGLPLIIERLKKPEVPA